MSEDFGYDLRDSGLLVPHKINVVGEYHGQIIRNGVVIDEFVEKNLVVDEGLNALLNIMFAGATQVPTWYLGVFEANYTPVAGVTGATIASAATECTAYAATNRPTYTEASSTAKSMTNSASRASFVFNASKNVYGAFLISDNTKGGTAGTLFSAARFSSAKVVAADDELLLTYTFTASSV